ncbi:MAG: hypothetical protein BA863_06095 [Desulfovibrio sp. S3730MH75]|nr:MAG: hypothetical protein BA863_06095 [Desulfovibrio sp. S3730MH75]
MKHYEISSDDMIILRDGRPFGESGVFGGTSLDWPFPQTIAGMCRSAVGLQRDPNFFKDSRNAKKIMKIGIQRLMPLLSADGDECLLPTPADLVFSGVECRNVHVQTYKPLGKGEGTDIACPHWLYPEVELKEKPTVRPKFLRHNFAERYLSGALGVCEEFSDEDANVVFGTVQETRIHTAINPKTSSADEGKLFAESGMYLVASKSDGTSGMQERITSPESVSRHTGVLGDIKICFSLSALEENERLPDSVYLGGERRRAAVRECETGLYPVLPALNGEEKFLKLLLTTHGDFGSWAPDWLVPGEDVSTCDWVDEPRSGVRIRLRSAVISGWDPVSGWDYAKWKPKAFRKLVCPGSVYLIELEQPDRAGELVNKLHGESLCGAGSQSELDGFGQVVVAKAMHISEGEE